MKKTTPESCIILLMWGFVIGVLLYWLWVLSGGCYGARIDHDLEMGGWFVRGDHGDWTAWCRGDDLQDVENVGR
jgi:hypothetical protein